MQEKKSMRYARKVERAVCKENRARCMNVFPVILGTTPVVSGLFLALQNRMQENRQYSAVVHSLSFMKPQHYVLG